MTNPISSFTVTVEFRGVVYDAKFTLRMKNGDPIDLPPDRVKQWKSAEKAHQLFSRIVQDMLEDAVPEGKKPQAADSEGVTCDDSSKREYTDKTLHPQLVDTFQNTASKTLSKTAGLSPVKKAASKVSAPGLDGTVEFSPNAYANLSGEERKRMRFNLFEKAFEAHFAGKKAIDYTEQETAYIDQFLNNRSKKDKPIVTLQHLLHDLWNSLADEEEKAELSRLFERKKAESKLADETDSVPVSDDDLISL